MSDEHLRELERRYLETGSVEAEQAYLEGRVRAGELSPSRFRLAALCGHAAARASRLVPQSKPPRAFADFVEEFLRSHGEEACRRACLAAGRAALAGARRAQRQRVGAQALDEETLSRAEQALAAGERWLEQPDEEHRGECERWNQIGVPSWAEVSLLFGRDWPTRARAQLREAARLGGKNRVRRRVEAALIRWALG